MELFQHGVTILSSKWLSRVAIGLLVVVSFYSIVIHSANGFFHSVVFFETQAADGPFQLLNALRRIQAGEVYQFFHGRGAALLHYPLFVMFGSDLTALQVTRYFTAYAVYLFTMLGVAVAALKQLHTRLLLIAILLAYGLIQWSASIVEPMNSSLGVRTFMPVVVFGLLFLQPSRWKTVAVGVALGMALMASTEHGSAIVLSFFGFQLSFMALKRDSLQSNARWLLLVAISAFVTFVVLIVASSGGVTEALKVLQFNFRDVPSDQVWYFGVLPNGYVDEWTDLLVPEFYLPVTWLVCLLITLLANLLRKKSVQLDQSPLLAGAILVGYGLISAASWVFSYQAFHLVQPAMRVAVLVTAVFALRLLDQQPTHDPVSQTDRRIAINISAIGVVFILLSQDQDYLLGYLRGVEGARQQADASQGRVISQYWVDYEAATVPAVDAAALSNPPAIWGVYSGFLHAHYDTFNPVEEDYIIQVLGEERRTHYVTQFQASQPQFVEAPRSDGFHYYYWMINENWSFFETVFANYKPLAETAHSHLMTRSDQAWRPLPTECETIPVNGTLFVIPEHFLATSDRPRVLTVAARYQTQNALGGVPLIGGLPRYYVRAANGVVTPVSLPPQSQQFTFPIILVTPGPESVVFEVSSVLPGAQQYVSEVCVREAVILEENRPLLLP